MERERKERKKERRETDRGSRVGGRCMQVMNIYMKRV